MKFNSTGLIEKGIMLCIVHFFIFAHSSTAVAAQIEPQRIVTLSPHLAELVFSLGAGHQLVGVVEHSNYPQQVNYIPRIGSASGLDIEQILSIKPDLVLAWQRGSRDADIKKLKELGLRVVSIKSESLEDIPESLKILGELLNRQQRSSTMIELFNKQLKTISDKYRDQAVYRVFIEISSQPLMGLTNRDPFAAGLQLCGLKNIFSNMDKGAIITDLESILSRDVAYVLLRQKTTSNDYDARKKFYQINDYSTIGFVSFDENTAFRQTPRLLEAVDEVCGAVYGLN
ncbi:MAG: ABC transporter substrate-binding protein [Arenicellales bacterium]